MARTATSRCQAPETMLDIDVAGSRPCLRRRDRDRARARGDHVRAADRGRAARHARRRRRQVHGAQRGELAATACSSACRRASSSSSRSTSGSRTRPPDGSLFWRLLVVAEEGSRFTLIEEYASAVARPRRLLERRRRALRRAGREARVRLAPEPLARDVALRHAPRARRAGRRARLGRRRLRLEEGEDADPERPRRPGRDLARHRRVLRRRRAAPRLRHVPGAHRPAHDLGLRVQGRACATTRRRSGAG